MHQPPTCRRFKNAKVAGCQLEQLTAELAELLISARVKEVFLGDPASPSSHLHGGIPVLRLA